MAQLNYNVGSEQESSFDALPAGDYVAVISNSEMKETKDGTGAYLQLSWEIVDGNMKGRKVFEKLNIQNRSEKAVAIARGSLNAICAAAGKQSINDSAELHNIPMMIKIIVKDDDQYGPKNVIKKHSAYGNQQAPAQQTQTSGVPSFLQGKTIGARENHRRGQNDDIPF